MDSLDFKIIDELSRNGRVTWSELAQLLGLSSPAIADRVKRLEEKGIIRGYTAKLNEVELGYMVTAFIAVSLEHPKYIAGFTKAIQHLSEIEECHHVAGEDDYFLKVKCRTNQHLDEFLNGKLKVIAGVSRTRTTIALSTVKDKRNDAFPADSRGKKS
jgi:Lrp/AsnC family transcriptional regulator, leucine-responsive regulatory protein